MPHSPPSPSPSPSSHPPAQMIPLYLERFAFIKKQLVSHGITAICDGGCGEGEGGLYWGAALKDLTTVICVDGHAPCVSDAHQGWMGRRETVLRDALLTHSYGMHGKRFAGQNAPLQAIGLQSDLSSYDANLHRILTSHGVRCMVLCEVVEHCSLQDASSLLTTALDSYEIDFLIVTTPDASKNDALGVPPNSFRHWDHKWEMDPTEFQEFVAKSLGRVKSDGFETEFCMVGNGSQAVLISRKGFFAEGRGGGGGGEEGVSSWSVTVPVTDEVELAVAFIREMLLEGGGGWVRADDVVTAVCATVLQETGSTVQSAAVRERIFAEDSCIDFWVDEHCDWEGGREDGGESEGREDNALYIAAMFCDRCDSAKKPGLVCCTDVSSAW